MNKDYSHGEISQVCDDLLTVHADKLKDVEEVFIKTMYKINMIQQISQHDRDTLIGIYDRMQGDSE